MGVSTNLTNKPILPRGNDQSPLAFNRAKLYSGKALSFDGVNDYVSVSYTEGIGSVWSWVSIIEFDSVSGYQELFGGQYGSTNATIYLKNTQLDFYTSGDNLNTDFDFETGKKYHIACSQSGDTISVYVNGQAAGSVSLTAQLNRSNGAYTIGKHPVNSNEYLNGKMSGVKLFNTALTAAQVSDLYNNPEKIVPTGVADSALKLWLPMMEGAGTTAYDGSGGGNHGTISGATWTHGIGAPVSQTAVIDWNKLYDFDGTNDEAYSSSYIDITGTKTYKVHFNSHDVTQGDQQIFQFWNTTTAKGMAATINFGGTNSAILGLRGYASGGSFNIQSWSGLTNNTFYELELTIDWAAESITSATLNGESADGNVNARLQTTDNGLYLGSRVTGYYLNGIINYFEVVGDEKWTNASGFKSESGSYDMTIVGSPSQILAPQGLTTGRDITGVNLFTYARKQSALNLDGNSWAEIHDNASLDITDAITLEAWVYNIQDGTTAKGIMGQWYGAVGGAKNSLLYKSDDDDFQFYVNISGVSYNITTGDSVTSGWHHIVGIYDGSNMKIYVDGAESATTARTGTLDTSTGAFEIGRYFGLLSNITNTPIAQPRIYNRALTAEEVARNFAAHKSIYTNS